MIGVWVEFCGGPPDRLDQPDTKPAWRICWTGRDSEDWFLRMPFATERDARMALDALERAGINRTTLDALETSAGWEHNKTMLDALQW